MEAGYFPFSPPSPPPHPLPSPSLSSPVLSSPSFPPSPSSQMQDLFKGYLQQSKRKWYFVCLQRSPQSREHNWEGPGEVAGPELQPWGRATQGDGRFGKSASRHRHLSDFRQDLCLFTFLSPSFSSHKNIMAAVKRLEEMNGTLRNLVEPSKVL